LIDRYCDELGGVSLSHVTAKNNRGDAHLLVAEYLGRVDIDYATCHVQCNTNEVAVMINGVRPDAPTIQPNDTFFGCAEGKLYMYCSCPNERHYFSLPNHPN
jgi:hypothetical protein